MNEWREAIIDELVFCHIYNKTHDDNPRKAIMDIIAWHVEVALDPEVSEAAQGLIYIGAVAENEACARLVVPNEEHRRDASWGYIGGEAGVELLDNAAAAIRARMIP